MLIMQLFASAFFRIKMIALPAPIYFMKPLNVGFCVLGSMISLSVIQSMQRGIQLHPAGID